MFKWITTLHPDAQAAIGIIGTICVAIGCVVAFLMVVGRVLFGA